jgi:hypothetical protein
MANTRKVNGVVIVQFAYWGIHILVFLYIVVVQTI